MSRTRVKVGEAIGPPKVSTAPKPASSIRTSSTLGVPGGAFGPGIMDQSGTDSLIVRLITPPKVRSGIGRMLRSWLNFPAAWASSSLRPLTADFFDGTTDFAGEVITRSAAARSSSSTMVMIAAVPGGICSPRPSKPCSSLCFTNLPISPPTVPLTTIDASNGGAVRPTSNPTPPPQPMPLRPRWSPVWRTVTFPSAAWLTRIAPSLRTVLSATSRTSASKSVSAAPSAAGYTAMIRE